MLFFSVRTKTKLPEQFIDTAIFTLKKQLLEELHDAIVSIIFFGSRRRGEFTPDSDIDVLIIIKEKDRQLINRIFEIADDIERNILSYRFSFSLHIQSKQEYAKFKELKSPFVSEIEREGDVVYARKTQP
jgi:predicted nucleotidyltransferase